MLHLKNSCRSFGVPTKLDVPQKDAVVKSMEYCVQQLASNANVLDVKIDSIFIQVMIMQCFRTLLYYIVMSQTCTFCFVLLYQLI